MIKYYLSSDTRFECATDGASGYDVMSDSGITEREMTPGTRWKVSTGLYLEMPRGVEAQIRSRSGLALNYGVIVLNAPGTIDSDYRGECCVTLINLGQQPWTLRPGERIAQIVFAPVLPDCIAALRQIQFEQAEELSFLTRVSSIDELSDTTRGRGGHGSTGQ